MEITLISTQLPQSIEEFRQILLENRGVADMDDFFAPIHPSKVSLEDVQIDKSQIKRAVQRIRQAIKEQQKIVIFGDYDADGICASAILWTTLNQLGLQTKPFIPHRNKHGYGISVKALEEIFEADKPDLIITVDNGIVAHDAIKFAKKQGVEVIITDHHQPEKKLPPADIVIHSTAVSGAGVAWFLARALEPDLAEQLLDLVAIATIADQVPLLGINRSLAKFGIEALRITNRPGLKALFNQAGIEQQSIDSYTVGFGIAPRINAMGRISHGLDALRLLCTNNPRQAQQLALLLNQTNQERKDLTSDALEFAKSQAESWKDSQIIITYSPNYHEGVIGLIAGKLTEQFQKPAIAISLGDEVAKGSARSIKGINITEMIRLVRDDLLDVGGHAMAAGFSLESSKVEKVIARLHELVNQKIQAGELLAPIIAECQIPYSLLSEDLVKSVEDFRPFGQANQQPDVLLQNLKVLDAFAMGQNKQHLKLMVGSIETNNLQPLACIAWNMGHLQAKLEYGDELSAVGNVEINIWKNRKNLQFKLKHLID
jgi:single-stranded-DNA-specific exonuclease